MKKCQLIMLFTATVIMSQGHAAQLDLDPEIEEAIRLSLQIQEKAPDAFDLEATLNASRQHYSDVSTETLVLRRSALNDLHERFRKAKLTGMTKDARNAFRRERSEILHTHVLPGESDLVSLIWSMDQEFANSLDSKTFKTKAEFNESFDAFWDIRLTLQLSIAQNDSMLKNLLIEDALIERKQMKQDFEEDIQLIVKAEESEHKRLADEESKQVVTEREAYRKSVQDALNSFKFTLQNDSFDGFVRYLERYEVPLHLHDDILLGIWEAWISERSMAQVQAVQPLPVLTVNSQLSAKEAAREHWAKK